MGPPPGQSSSGESRTSHEEPAAWSRVIFAYNPNKRLAGRGWILASISVLLVSIAFGTSLAVLETGPAYFSCHNLFVICSFGLWIIVQHRRTGCRGLGVPQKKGNGTAS
jgi:hypothetical protein